MDTPKMTTPASKMNNELRKHINRLHHAALDPILKVANVENDELTGKLFSALEKGFVQLYEAERTALLNELLELTKSRYEQLSLPETAYELDMNLLELSGRKKELKNIVSILGAKKKESEGK
jgi:hypothetical protein